MATKDVNITISFGTIVKSVLVILLVGFLFVLKSVVLIVLTAIVIASAMEPAVKRLSQYRISRVFSVLLIYAILILIFALLFYAFVPILLEETSALLSILPAYTSTLDLSSSLEGTQTVRQSVGGGAYLQSVIDEFRNTLSTTSGGFIQILTTVFGGLLGFVLVIVFSFYFSVQQTGVDDFLRIVSPIRYQDKIINLWERSQVKIGLWMQGQLILAVIIGVLVYLGLTILGVPYALLLALLAALFELIPVFGPILAAIPAVAIAFIDSGATLALLVVGLYLIIQQFENHLIYPLVVTKVVGVPPLLVILALLVGAHLAGFFGVILSVPAAAIIQELVHDLELSRNGKMSKRPTTQ